MKTFLEFHRTFLEYLQYMHPEITPYHMTTSLLRNKKWCAAIKYFDANNDIQETHIIEDEVYEWEAHQVAMHEGDAGM